MHFSRGIIPIEQMFAAAFPMRFTRIQTMNLAKGLARFSAINNHLYQVDQMLESTKCQ